MSLSWPSSRRRHRPGVEVTSSGFNCTHGPFSIHRSESQEVMGPLPPRTHPAVPAEGTVQVKTWSCYEGIGHRTGFGFEEELAFSNCKLPGAIGRLGLLFRRLLGRGLLGLSLLLLLPAASFPHDAVRTCRRVCETPPASLAPPLPSSPRPRRMEHFKRQPLQCLPARTPNARSVLAYNGQRCYTTLSTNTT